MTEKLEPCPWCGPNKVTAGHTSGTLFRAGCERCDIEWTRPTYDQAVTAWNRRALPSPLTLEMEKWLRVVDSQLAHGFLVVKKDMNGTALLMKNLREFVRKLTAGGGA